LKLLTYCTIGGKDLPKDESALGYAIINSLSEYGFDALEGLETRQIKGKLWEIKFRRQNRIFYVVVENGYVYLVDACKKLK
jgi:hypothetical protein